MRSHCGPLLDRLGARRFRFGHRYGSITVLSTNQVALALGGYSGHFKIGREALEGELSKFQNLNPFWIELVQKKLNPFKFRHKNTIKLTCTVK